MRGGRIVDGTGSPWYRGDVGVRGGRIAAIGDLSSASAARVVDAGGLVVAPGFIDMLGQSDLTILVDPRVPSKIHQGITTEITGESESAAPLGGAMLEENAGDYRHYGIEADWRTLPQYFARLEKQGIGINFGTYVGASGAREIVLGYDDVAPTPEQLAKMQAIIADAMRAGALGVSTALQYPPASYAKTDELIALAKPACAAGGIYATHLRNEGDAEPAALEEALRIGREAGCAVEIFHLKVAGKRNWGKMGDLVARIEAARASGLDVTADTYAYTAWQEPLSAFVPPSAQEGGMAKLAERLKDPAQRAHIAAEIEKPTSAWDDEWLEVPGPDAVVVTAVTDPSLVALQGKRLDEIARLWREQPLQALLDLLVKDAGHGFAASFGMSEADVALALKQPWVSICNDAPGSSPDGVLGREHPHPRAYGTFPRILKKYVREEKLLTLPDAIRKFTALAAQRVGLADRGVIKRGMWADLVVFDPDAVGDVATFGDPNRLSVGMRWVIVNGVPVIADGAMTGARPGRVLYGPGRGAAE